MSGFPRPDGSCLLLALTLFGNLLYPISLTNTIFGKSISPSFRETREWLQGIYVIHGMRESRHTALEAAPGTWFAKFQQNALNAYPTRLDQTVGSFPEINGKGNPRVQSRFNPIQKIIVNIPSAFLSPVLILCGVLPAEKRSCQGAKPRSSQFKQIPGLPCPLLFEQLRSFERQSKRGYSKRNPRDEAPRERIQAFLDLLYRPG